MSTCPQCNGMGLCPWCLHDKVRCDECDSTGRCTTCKGGGEVAGPGSLPPPAPSPDGRATISKLRIAGQTDRLDCVPGEWRIEVVVSLDGRALAPQPPITFQSSSPSVAMLSSAVPPKLKALASGSTRVTASCTEYQLVSVIDVNVREPEPEPSPIERF